MSNVLRLHIISYDVNWIGYSIVYAYTCRVLRYSIKTQNKRLRFTFVTGHRERFWKLYRYLYLYQY